MKLPQIPNPVLWEAKSPEVIPKRYDWLFNVFVAYVIALFALWLYPSGLGVFFTVLAVSNMQSALKPFESRHGTLKRFSILVFLGLIAPLTAYLLGLFSADINDETFFKRTQHSYLFLLSLQTVVLVWAVPFLGVEGADEADEE